jgi:hypothetical protein
MNLLDDPLLLLRFDLAFEDLIQNSTAYRTLVAAGIESWSLLDICVGFHAFEVIRAAELAHLKAQKLPLPNGRPRSLFMLFQCACDLAVYQRSDRRRFYAEFRDLAAMVFGRYMTVESYCRVLKRGPARGKNPATPTRRNSVSLTSTTSQSACAS